MSAGCRGRISGRRVSCMCAVLTDGQRKSMQPMAARLRGSSAAAAFITSRPVATALQRDVAWFCLPVRAAPRTRSLSAIRVGTTPRRPHGVFRLGKPETPGSRAAVNSLASSSATDPTVARQARRARWPRGRPSAASPPDPVDRRRNGSWSLRLTGRDVERARSGRPGPARPHDGRTGSWLWRTVRRIWPGLYGWR